MSLSLEPLSSIDGFIGASLVDADSAMVMAMTDAGGSFDLEIASAGNSEVVRAKRKTMEALALNDQIEDMLITLGQHYHLIRPLESNNALFLYLVLNRSKANLAMARMELRKFEKTLELG